MRKRLFWWEAVGFLFVAAAGTLLHFTYGWSGGSVVAAAFSAVNESTWEHMKILFFPMFLFSVAQLWFLGRNYPHFLAVRTVSVLTGVCLIPVLFYTYAGVLGYTADRLNIATFFVADFLAFALDFHLLGRNRLSALWQQILGLAVLWALSFLFVWCTFHPPALGMWRDPLTGTFGIPF